MKTNRVWNRSSDRLLTPTVLSVVLCANLASAQSGDLQKRAASTFRALAERIKACQPEKEFGDDPDHSGVMYFEPPINVTWDVFPNPSARAPLAAYIEFATPRKFVISTKGASHFDPKYQDEMTQAAWTQRHRYEFDISSSGVDLVRTLRFGKADWIDEEPDKYCWQNSAREVTKRSPTASGDQ